MYLLPVGNKHNALSNKMDIFSILYKYHYRPKRQWYAHSRLPRRRNCLHKELQRRGGTGQKKLCHLYSLQLVKVPHGQSNPEGQNRQRERQNRRYGTLAVCTVLDQ